jgi:parallel beta-helix repeat protein
LVCSALGEETVNMPDPHLKAAVEAEPGISDPGYTSVTYELFTLSTSGGTVTDPGEGTYEYPGVSIIDINAVAEPGYCFAEWTGTAVDAGKVADPHSSHTTAIVDSDYTLNANFRKIQIIHVDDDGSADFNNIQAGIDAAQDGDIVCVAPGIYVENVILNSRINFVGAGADVTIIDANGYADVVDIRAKDVMISGFTLRNSGESDLYHTNCGVHVDGNFAPVIEDNTITDNEIGIALREAANPDIKNNIIENNNTGIYIYGTEEQPSNPRIINNTIVNNERDGITLRMMASPVISNNIIAENAGGINCNYITGTPLLSYNNLWNNDANYVRNESIDDTLAGPGSLSVDPSFAGPGFWADANDPNMVVERSEPNAIWVQGDYHLKSNTGRWDPKQKLWLQDDVNSPCIDAGDPNSDLVDEVWPHGKRINMGAYGGTTQASMSSSNAGDIRDLNNDSFVTWDDVLLLADRWDSKDVPLKEDLNLDGIVDINDLIFFEGNWSLDADNSAPAFDSIDSQYVTVGGSLTFTATASYIDNDELIYIALGLPEGAEFSNQVFNWTPQQAGTYFVTFIVSDRNSLDYMTVQITVDQVEEVSH